MFQPWVFLIHLLHTFQSPEEKKKPTLAISSKRVCFLFGALLIFIRKRIPPTPTTTTTRRDMDESFIFETVVNKSWVSRPLESFPEKTPRERSRRLLHLFSDVGKKAVPVAPGGPQERLPGVKPSPKLDKGLHAPQPCCFLDCWRWAAYLL